jgi:uncharacterized protein (UPF0248 family)
MISMDDTKMVYVDVLRIMRKYPANVFVVNSRGIVDVRVDSIRGRLPYSRNMTAIEFGRLIPHLRIVDIRESGTLYMYQRGT